MTTPIGPLTPASTPPAAGPLRGAVSDGGGDAFADMVRSQLEQVSRVQGEADRQVQQLVTGASDSLTDVFVAARKAEVAFSLLMEIRNKLVEAYQELQNLRV